MQFASPSYRGSSGLESGSEVGGEVADGALGGGLRRWRRGEWGLEREVVRGVGAGRQQSEVGRVVLEWGEVGVVPGALNG